MTKARTQKANQPEPEWPADKVARRPLASLIPYARNSRTHSEHQVAQIAASMREWGWTSPVLIDEEGTIIAGHARVQAAHMLGLEEVPCMVAMGWTDAQRRAYVIADNRLALNADWDFDMLRLELAELEEGGFDTDLLGWGDELPQFADAPDYGLLDATDPQLERQLDEMADGVKKAILIEFDLENYELAKELVKYWREQGRNVGLMFIDVLSREKIAQEALEENGGEL